MNGHWNTDKEAVYLYFIARNEAEPFMIFLRCDVYGHRLLQSAC